MTAAYIITLRTFNSSSSSTRSRNPFGSETPLHNFRPTANPLSSTFSTGENHSLRYKLAAPQTQQIKMLSVRTLSIMSALFALEISWVVGGSRQECGSFFGPKYDGTFCKSSHQRQIKAFFLLLFFSWAPKLNFIAVFLPISL